MPEAVVGAYLHFSATRRPRELLFSVLRSLRHAWCTIARFGNAPIACLLRCGLLAGDSQAHPPDRLSKALCGRVRRDLQKDVFRPRRSLRPQGAAAMRFYSSRNFA